jgi:hypothetical protein
MAVSEVKIAKIRVWNREEDDSSRRDPVSRPVDLAMDRSGRSKPGPRLVPTGQDPGAPGQSAGHQAGLTGSLAGPTGH